MTKYWIVKTVDGEDRFLKNSYYYKVEESILHIFEFKSNSCIDSCIAIYNVRGWRSIKEGY